MNSVLISGLNKSQFNEIIGVLTTNGYSVAKVTVANCRSALAVPNHPIKGRKFVYGKSSSVRVGKRLNEAGKNSSAASKTSAPSNSLKKGKQSPVKEGAGKSKKTAKGSSKQSSKPVADTSGSAPASSGTKPARWADEVEPGTSDSPTPARTVLVPSKEDVEKRLAALKPVRVEGYVDDSTCRRFDAVVNSVNPYGLPYFKLAKASKKVSSSPIEFRKDKPRASLYRKLLTLGFPVLNDSMLLHRQEDDKNFIVSIFPGSARECNVTVPIKDGGDDYTTAVNAAIATEWDELSSISSAYDILPILRVCD